jgi:peptidoglycan/xylan/chitin deacetylase (PgdA/CDA1 family)
MIQFDPNPMLAGRVQDAGVPLTRIGAGDYETEGVVELGRDLQVRIGIVGSCDDICEMLPVIGRQSLHTVAIAPERFRSRLESALNLETNGHGQFVSSDTSLAGKWSGFNVLINASPVASPVLFEAIANSMPIVTVKSSNLPSLFADRRCALSFSRADQLAGILDTLRQDPVKRREIASRARNRLQREYSMSYITRDYRGFGYSLSDVRPASRRGIFARLITRSIPKRWLAMQGSGARREFAITFDDGPDPEFTPVVLNILREFGVTATFYVVGNRAEQFPELIQRIAAAGHEIASHSHTHPHFRRIRWSQAKQELTTAERAIRCAGAALSPQLRPPFGDLSLKTLLSAWSMGLTVVLWSVDLRDYAGVSSDEMLQNLDIANISDGDIILYHATNHAAVAALPAVLERAIDGCRRGVAVSQFIRS